MSVDNASSVLDRYLEKVIQENRTIDARGVMQVNRMIALSMDDVFIHLTVRMSRGKNFTPDEDDKTDFIEQALERGCSFDELAEKGEEGFLDNKKSSFQRLPEVEIEKGVPTDKLWQRSHNWVLLGDPGAGKTTLLKHFALKAAAACQAGKGHLPVLVPLRLFGKKLENHACWQEHEAVLNYVTQFSLVEMGFTAECDRVVLRKYFEDALSQGNMLFMLDGLDEQRDAHIQKLTVKTIESMQRQYPGNRFIVTSRIVGYDAAPLSSAFNSATLEPFNDDQMKRFFNNWCYALEKSEDPINDVHTRQRAGQHATQLLSQIESNPGVRQLATNPLLCTIIGLIHHRGAALPQNRAELYKLCIDTFIFNWEMHKRHRDDQDDSLDKDQTQAVLEEIALHIHENYPENRIPKETLTRITAEFLINQQGLAEADAQQKANQMLSLIRDVSGLLIDRGGSEYGFFHLTFQEYLTARAITRKKSKIDEYLNKYLFEARWREVIRLAAAHQGQKDAESGSEFIEAILRQKHVHDEFMHYSFRMAFLCLQESRVELGTSDRMMQRWIGYLHETKFEQLFLQLLQQSGKSIRYYAKTLESLIDFLKDENFSVRSSAAYALGVIGDAQAIPPLIDALKDEDSRVRIRAAYALGRIGDAQAIPPLIDALKDENSRVRWSAADALGGIGDAQAIPPLIDALKDKDFSVRSSAVYALGVIGDAQDIPPLIDALKDENYSVRIRAAYALGRIGDAQAIPPLIDALKDENYSVRIRAAYAYRRIGDAQALTPLIDALKDENSSVRSSAAYALGGIGDAQALTPLIDALKDEYSSVRSSAADALGRIGDAQAIPPLIDALKDENSSVRRRAADALGRIGDAQAIPPLIDALKDENSSVRSGAADALGRIGDAQAIPPLIDALKDENSSVRSSAADALGRIGDAQAIPPLIDALKDENSSVRRSAADALGRIGDAQAIPPLIDALKDENSRVRWSAADALGGIGDAQAIPPLIDALKDENSRVRWSAVQVIEKIDLGYQLCPD